MSEPFDTELLKTIAYSEAKGDWARDVLWERASLFTVKELVDDIVSHHLHGGRICIKGLDDFIDFCDGKAETEFDEYIANKEVKFVYGECCWTYLTVIVFLSNDYLDTKQYKATQNRISFVQPLDILVNYDEAYEPINKPYGDYWYYDEEHDDFDEIPPIDAEQKEDELFDLTVRTDESGKHYFNLTRFANAEEVCNYIVKTFKNGNIKIRPLVLVYAADATQPQIINFNAGEQKQELRKDVLEKTVVKVGFYLKCDHWNFTIYYA